MIEIMALPIAIVMTLSMWILLSAVFYKPEKYEYPSIKKGRFLEERTKSYYNFFALIFNIRDGSLSKDVKELELELPKLKSKDPLDKEIEELEKNIKIERDRKEKIQRRSELEAEYDRLYQENETSDYMTDIDSLPVTGGVSANAMRNHVGLRDVIGNSVPPPGERTPPKPKYKCPECGGTKVSSGARYSITIEGSGVVQVMECSDCGTEIEEEDR